MCMAVQDAWSNHAARTAHLQSISVLQLRNAFPEVALQSLRTPRELQLLLLSHCCQLLQSALCMGLHAGNLCTAQATCFVSLHTSLQMHDSRSSPAEHAGR